MNLSGCGGHVKYRCARRLNPVHNSPVPDPTMAVVQLRRKTNMLGNFFSGARKYLSGAISALASHLPLMADRSVLSNDVAGLTPRPLGVGERKSSDSGRFWWRASWLTARGRHAIQNNKVIMANENTLLQALLKRNAYYQG